MNQVNTLWFQVPFPFKQIIFWSVSWLVSLLFVTACEKKTSEPPDTSETRITIRFEHRIDGQKLQYDTLLYVNEAGNPYMVNEIQYFISDVILYPHNKGPVTINEWKDIHYIDTDLPTTLRWDVYDQITAGQYDSVGFHFGIAESENISFMYPNPPERDMFWPEYLGGGYHYMKLNGKWLPEGQSIQTLPFDFHMGIGQIYDSVGAITGYVHNDFPVILKSSQFEIMIGETKEIAIVMNIENWFKDPNIYNHDLYGGYIMQNQTAMQKAKENGHNVFTFAETKN